MPLSLFCVGHLLLGMDLHSRVICIPSETPLKKTNFFICERLSNKDSFKVKIETCVHFSKCEGPYPVQTRTRPVHAAILSVSSNECYPSCSCKALFSCVLHLLWLL